jgi:glucosamine kinase
LKIWIGIDGGGTRATAVALDETGGLRSRVEGGAALVDPVHPLSGAEELAALARRAFAESGARGTPAGLCCALAGAARISVRDALTAELQRLDVANYVCVVSDAAAALHDAFSDRAGVLLIAGTGSVAWGRTAEGKTARAGGWGTLLGDEGSGYALGLAALSAVVRASDGREQATSLTAGIFQATGCTMQGELIPWTAASDKAGIASLAPVVVEAAARSDAVARAIVDSGAAELAQQVLAVVNATRPWSTKVPIAFAGGLISPGRPLRDPAWRAVQALPYAFDLAGDAVDAARGAANIARAGA